MFYVEVTEAMRRGAGGGNVDEGESIEVVEVPVEGSMEYIVAKDTTPNKSLGLCFAVMWYHQFKAAPAATSAAPATAVQDVKPK